MMFLLMLCRCWKSLSRSKLCVRSFHKPDLSGFYFDFFIRVFSTEPIFKLFPKVKFNSERLYFIFEQLLNKLTKSLNNFLLLFLEFDILSIDDQGKSEKRLFCLLLRYERFQKGNASLDNIWVVNIEESFQLFQCRKWLHGRNIVSRAVGLNCLWLGCALSENWHKLLLTLYAPMEPLSHFLQKTTVCLYNFVFPCW